MNLAAKGGHNCFRRRQGLSEILEKKPVVQEVEKLRSIILMEADFKSPNKVFIGGTLTKVADKKKVLPTEQYGEKNGHGEIESGINNKLLFGIIRMWIWEAAIVSVDANTCYDRFQHNTVS